MSQKRRYLIRRLLLKLLNRIPLSVPEPSIEAIDVVIPLSLKDLKILPLCLNGIRRNVTNTIKNIYIVSSNSEGIKSFCMENQCVFIDENDIFGFKPSELHLIIDDGRDRSGWLFQQLVKLSGSIGTCDYYLTVDADHILIKPHTFLEKSGKSVFYMSSELHQAYYDMIQRIIGPRKLACLSFVSHKMIFNKHELNRLKTIIEEKTEKEWIEGIRSAYDLKEGSGFSEFETYGNFVSNRIFRPWKQKLLKYDELNSLEELCDKYSSRYNSLTFPDYDKR